MMMIMMKDNDIEQALTITTTKEDKETLQRDDEASLCDASETPNSEEDEQDAATRRLVQNRAMVSVLRYMLGFPKTSVTFFLFIVCFVLPVSRPYESVRQPMQDLNAFVHHEAARANESYFQRYSTVVSEMTLQAIAARQELHHHRSQNQLLAEQIKAMELQAYDQIQSSRRLLQHIWSNNHIINSTALIFRHEQCSAEEWSNLTRRVYGNQQLAASQDNVLGAVNQFVETSRATLKHVSDYSQQRTRYDYDYFIGLKMTPALALIQSIQVPALNFTAAQVNLLMQLELLIDDLLTNPFNDFSVRLELYQAHMMELSVSVANFHVYSIDLYSRLESTMNWVRDFIPMGFPIPRSLDISGMPMPDSFLPNMELPSFAVPLPNVTAVKLDFSNKALIIVSDFLAELAREASQETQEAIGTALEALQKLLTLEDYHPPQYESLHGGTGMDDENVYMEQTGQDAMNQSTSALKDVLASWQDKRQDIPSPDLSMEDDLEDDTYDDYSGESLYRWMAVELPSISLPFLASVVAFVISWKLALDVAIQFVRLWHLQKKWEDCAVPTLPDINLASTPRDSNDRGNLSMTQIGHILLENCTFGAWMSLILGLVLLFTLAIYVPTVKAQCIDSLEGTFIARKFMGPNYVNEAYRQGSARVGILNANIRKERRDLCEFIYDNGKRYEQMLYDTHQAAVNAQIALILDAQYERQLLMGCIDVERLSEHLTSSCCGLESYSHFDYKTEQNNLMCAADQQKDGCPMDPQTDPLAPFQSLSEYLSHSVFDNFDADEWALIDTKNVDYCNVLDSYEILELDAIHENLILDLSIEAFCKAEVWSIQIMVGGCVLLIFYLIMQFKCDLFFDGTKRCFWRQLTTEGTIKCYAEVREDGSFSVKVNMEERSARIRSALSTYEFIGTCKLRLSAFLLVLEIILAFVLKRFLQKWFGDYV